MRPLFPRARAAAAVAAVTTLALLAAACGGGGPTKATTAAADVADLHGVTLRVGDQVSISKTLLQASGQDQALPYAISWSTFAAGPPLLEAINAGAIDLGGVGDAPPIFAQASGAALKVVAASHAADATQSSQAILVRKGSTISDVAQLKGKKVAVARGSASHWLLLAALQKAGLGIGDVQVSYLLPADALAAFQGGDVDAWAVWDPYVSIAEQQGAHAITTGAGLIGGYSFQVARPGALNDPRLTAAIGDYLARLAVASKWAAQHKPEWATRYAQLTKLPDAIAASTLDHFTSTYVPVDDQVRKAQQDEADGFKAAGLIPKAIDVAQVLDTRYTERLKEA